MDQDTPVLSGFSGGQPFLDFDKSLKWLRECSTLEDSELNLFEIALAFALPSHRGVNLQRYRLHYVGLLDELKSAYKSVQHHENLIEGRRQVLQTVLYEKQGYIGDDRDYDNLENADMIRVIDRRMGMPITLCILAVQLCRDLGWDAEGINFPGHFIMRLDDGANRLLVDPFQGFKILEASDLRTIIKKTQGANAELSADFYVPAPNRDIVLRLHNNVKLRLIEQERYEEALESLSVAKAILTEEFRLWFDSGIVQARMEQPLAAISDLQHFIAHCPGQAEVQEAHRIIQSLKKAVH